MSPVRTTCPYCGELTQMAPAEILLALTDLGGTTGDYAYTCPQCLRTAVHTADELTIATLLCAGVTPVRMTNVTRTEHP